MTPPSSRRVLPIGASSARDARQHPAGDVAVTVEVLRGALHRQVDAQGQRLLIDRTGEGIVDARQHVRRRGTPAATARMSTQRSVGLIGDSNHTSLVLGPMTRAGVGEFLQRDEPPRDAETPVSRCSIR